MSQPMLSTSDAGPEMMRDLFDYVGFGRRDEALLAQLAPALRPCFPALVDEFYRAVERTPRARAVFRDGEAQIERQKARLAEWLEGVVGGVYDDDYFARRARIGRRHVQIELDPRYMFGAMNLVRAGLHRALEAAPDVSPEDRRDGHVALDRICDVELAIMLETYRERYDERQRVNERLATIGQLAASIGHELRNPLAVMDTSVQLLQRREQTGEVSKHLDRIRQQIEISGAIIDDVLALAHGRPLRRVPVDFAAVAREALGMLSVPDTVEVQLALPATLPPVWIDPSQMRQVVLNLVNNALQAIASNGARGHIELAAWIEPDGTFGVSITDDGPGLAPEIEGRLFEPLATTRPTGSGLGLALVKEIVERHGGAIESAPPPDRGARFVLRVPPMEASAH